MKKKRRGKSRHFGALWTGANKKFKNTGLLCRRWAYTSRMCCDVAQDHPYEFTNSLLALVPARLGDDSGISLALPTLGQASAPAGTAHLPPVCVCLLCARWVLALRCPYYVRYFVQVLWERAAAMEHTSPRASGLSADPTGQVAATLQVSLHGGSRIYHTNLS